MNKTNLVCMGILLSLAGCGLPNLDEKKEQPVYDPRSLSDTYEREVKIGCDGKQVSDKVQRKTNVSSIKINPKKNIYIASASFFNLENGQEYTPNVTWPGDGGDNRKWVSFCQEPRPADHYCLPVRNGENRIQYKYWVQTNPDVMGEMQVRTIRFKVKSKTSKRTCTRHPKTCPMTPTTEWSSCKY
jgi:hypothetical protein